MGALRTCIFILFALISRASLAQEVDTTQTPVRIDSLVVPDSTVVPDSAVAQNRISPQDSLRLARASLPLVPFLNQLSGTAIGDTLPTRHPSLDPQGILGEVLGSFIYDFGASGWPDGWSPYGLSPNNQALSFNHIPFNDLSSGLPSYDLLPFSMLQQLNVQPALFGTTIGVNTGLRSFDDARPLTEIRYRSSNNGLQSVLVSHSQRRRLQLAGWPGQIHLLLAYGGHGANGEYAGSRLEGARQLVARVRIQNALGSFEITNLHNRRRLGAHAGAIPGIGSNFTDIYNRFDAQVINPNAQRQKIRNDLSITLRKPLLANTTNPFAATGYWTANTFRYVNSDTLQARTSTFGYSLSQALPFRTGSVALHLEGALHRVRKDSRDTTSTISALPDSLGIKRNNFQAYAQMAFNTESLNVLITPGLYSNTHSTLLGGSVEANYNVGVLRFFVNASRTLTHVPLVAEYGWGSSTIPLASVPSPETTLLKGGISLNWKAFDLTVSAFTHESVNSFDYVMNATV